MSEDHLQQLNPFPGLRPFRSDEHHLFFGREEQTAALLQLLRKNRFLAVVGTSGSGKSSLVRAGMIAELYSGTMTHAGSAWEIIVLRPGGSPLENMARAMVEADLYDPDDTDTLPRLRATLSRSRFGLVEAVKQSDVFEEDTNLLVVVDQFEELFRFRQQGVGSEEAAAGFVNLLLTASQQSERPIYVTITMRSDYLGDCSEIPGLAEAVNDGEYLIPRLMRDQKRDAIEKPIGVGGATISPLLVQRLLNEVGDDPDHLPVLQHALMRMWDVWAAGGNPDRPIDFSDFEAVGQLSKALSIHADELYESLPDDRHRNVCQRVFKTLTEKGADNRGIRRPTRLCQLQAIAGADPETIRTILEVFRQPGVTFLMPGVDVELTDRTVIDLSHESLMRGWEQLRQWVEVEAQSARIFRRLVDTARLWEEGRAGLFRDPDLQISLSWREQEHPNSDWAEQYGGGFENAIAFLVRSAEEVESEQRAREVARQRELEQAQKLAEAERLRAAEQAQSARRLRGLVRGLGLVLMVAVVASIMAWFARQEAQRNAVVADDKAREAERQREMAFQSQQQTQQALTEVDRQREQAVAAETAAIEAERRSREFRYATDMQLAAMLLETEGSNARQVMQRLSDYDTVTGAESEDLRGFEWYYARQLIEGQSSTFEEDVIPVVSAALTTAGDELLTLNREGVLRRREIATRQPTRAALDLSGGERVLNAALSPDGRRAAVAVANRVFVYDTGTGEQTVASLNTQARMGLKFSPDSRVLVTVDNTLGWWEVETGKAISLYRSSVTRSGPVSVSEDGLTVAVGGQGSNQGVFSVFRLDRESRDVTAPIQSKNFVGSMRAIALSPDGNTLAVSQFFSNLFVLYEVNTGKELRWNSTEHQSAISAIQFEPSGPGLITASMDGAIKFWKDFGDLSSAQRTLPGHPDEISALEFAGTNRTVITMGRDRTTRVWELDRAMRSLLSSQAQPTGYRAQFSPDGLLIATSGSSDRVELREAVSGEIVRVYQRSGRGAIQAVAFSPDNRLLAAGFGEDPSTPHVELWDIDTGELVAALPEDEDQLFRFNGPVNALAFSPDKRHLVVGVASLGSLGSGDQGSHPLLVYDVESRRVIRRLEGHRNDCLAIVFSPDGGRMASACFDGTVRIWETSGWQTVLELRNPDRASQRGVRRVTDVAYSPDGKLLAMASLENNVIVWDAATGQHLQTLTGHSNGVWSVAFSPDGRTLASGAEDNTIRFWNTATWREMMAVPTVQGYPTSLQFAPDGSQLLARARDQLVRTPVLSPMTAEELLTQRLKVSLESSANFASRIRMLGDVPGLHAALELVSKARPENAQASAAAAAARANWHAARQEWKEAAGAHQETVNANAGPPAAWLRTSGLLNVALALAHEGRLPEATQLLAVDNGRRRVDALPEISRRTANGFAYRNDAGRLVVLDVLAGSPAAESTLRPGDRIVRINGVEVTPELAQGVGALFSAQAIVSLRLTVQHQGTDDIEDIELSRREFLFDPETGEALHGLLQFIRQRIEEQGPSPDSLQLRAELATQWNGQQEQLADLTAAIDLLAQNDSSTAMQRRQRLLARRGAIHAEMQNWQRAFDDFAAAELQQADGEQLLAAEARAKAYVLNAGLDAAWVVLEPTSQKSLGGADLRLLSDGSILARGTNPDRDVYTVTARPQLAHVRAIRIEVLPHPSLPRNGPGRFPDNGNFHLNELRLSAGNQVAVLHEIAVSFSEDNQHGKVIDGVVDDARGWSINPQAGQANTACIATDLEIPAETELKLELIFSRAQWTRHNLGRFRVSVTDQPLLFARTKRDLAGARTSDSWVALAEAYESRGDSAAVDALVDGRPELAGAIGGFLADADQLQRAVAIYGRAIDAGHDAVELYQRRATVLERLKDWEAAVADWTRVARSSPRGFLVLPRFAERLTNGGQPELAETIRLKAIEILKQRLAEDAEDPLARTELSNVLFAATRPREPVWTVSKPDSVASESQFRFTLLDDGVIRWSEPDTDGNATRDDPASVPLQLSGVDLRDQAVRVEFSAPVSDVVNVADDFPDSVTVVPSAITAQGQSLRGRYIRLDLPGDNGRWGRPAGERKMINLIELQVFRGGENLALKGQATQSSSYGSSTAQLAIDGRASGVVEEGLVAHTSSTDEDPWWQLDLGATVEMDRVVVWNRPNWITRMSHFRIRILDEDRRVVFERVSTEPPRPTVEIPLQGFHLEPVASTDSPADSEGWNIQLPLAFRPAGSDSRLRILSTGERLLSLDELQQFAQESAVRHLPTRLAVAWARFGEEEQSRDWARAGLAQAEGHAERNDVLRLLQNYPTVLQRLLKESPELLEVQLAIARSHVTSGQRAFSGRLFEEAILEFERARETFENLRARVTAPEWKVLTPSQLTSMSGTEFTQRDDGSILAGGVNPDREMYTLTVPAGLPHIRAIRLEGLQHPSLPQQGPGRYGTNGNFHLTRFRVRRGDVEVPVNAAAVSYAENSGYVHIFRSDPVHGYWGVARFRGQPGLSNQKVSMVFATDLQTAPDDELTIVLDFSESDFDQHNLGCFRLAVTGQDGALRSTELHRELTDSELTALDVSLTHAYEATGQTELAAQSLLRALDRTATFQSKKELVDQFLGPDSQGTLETLARLQPREPSVNLALATQHAQRGAQWLEQQRQDDAIDELQQAQEVFARLLENSAEPQWDVLTHTGLISQEGAQLVQRSDGSVLVSGRNPPFDVYTMISEVAEVPLTALRIETLPSDRLPQKASGRNPSGNFKLNEFRAFLVSPDGSRRALELSEADDNSTNIGHASNAIDGSSTTWWAVFPNQAEPHYAVFAVAQPVAPALDEKLVIEIESGSVSAETLGCFRLSVTDRPNPLRGFRVRQQVREAGLAELEMSLADAHIAKGQVETSVDAFERVLRLAGDRTELLQVLNRAGRHDGVLQQLAARCDDDARVQFALAELFASRGLVAESQASAARARTLYAEALKNDPLSVARTQELADLLLELTPVEWQVVDVVDMKSLGGAELTVLPDLSILASGKNPPTDSYRLVLESSLREVRAVRIEALPHESLPNNGPGRGVGRGNFCISQWRFESATRNEPDQVTPHAFARVVGNFDYRLPLTTTGWNIAGHERTENVAAFELPVPIESPSGFQFRVFMTFHDNQAWADQNLGRFRISVTAEPEALEREQARFDAREISNPWVRLAAAHLVHRDTESASEAIKAALQVARTDETRSAVVRLAAGDPELLAVLESGVLDSAELELGQTLYLAPRQIAEGELEAAVALLTRSLEHSPSHRELLELRAQAFVELRRWSEAEADYARLIEVNADEVSRRAAEQAWAETLLRQGRWEEAADYYVQQMFIQNQWQPAYDAFAAQLLAGNRAGARLAARILYDRTARLRAPSIVTWLGVTYAAAPGLADAGKLDNLLRVAGDSQADWQKPLAAMLRFRAGQEISADELLSSAGNNAVGRIVGALRLLDQQEPNRARQLINEAEDALQQYRDRDPQSAVPLVPGLEWQMWAIRRALWQEAQRRLDYGPRLARLDATLQRTPSDVEARLIRARLLASIGLFDESERDVRRLEKLNADPLQLSALRGQIHAANDRNEQALEELNRAVEGGSRDALVFAARGHVLLKQGQTEAAREDLEKSLELEVNELAADGLADLLLRELPQAVDWRILDPEQSKSEGGATLTELDDHSILASGPNPTGDTYTIVTRPGITGITAIRLEALTDDSLPNRGPGRDSNRDPGNFAIVGLEVVSREPDGPSRSVQLSGVVTDYRSAGTPDLPTNWNVGGRGGQPHVAWLQLATPLELSEEAVLGFRLKFSGNSEWPGQNLGRFRLAATVDPQAFDWERRRQTVLSAKETWYRLSEAWDLTGEADRIHKLLERSPEKAAELAEVYGLNRDWQRAVRIYDRLITEDTRDVSLLVRRAKAYGQLQQSESADADWQRAFELSDDEAELRQSWLDALTAEQRWEPIAAYYSRQLDETVEGRAGYSPRSRLLETVIKRQDGVLPALLKLRPDDSLLPVAVARDFVLQSEWKQAAEAYPEQFQQDVIPDEWYEYAAAQLLAGKREEFEAAVKRMAEAFGDTDDPFVAYALARTATLVPHEVVPYDKVVEWAELAATREGEKGWYLHVAGMARLRAGDLDEATSWIAKSSQTNWHRELNDAAMCLILARRGDKASAREYLVKVQEWRADREETRQGDYYQVQDTDWMELNILLQEAEAGLREVR